MPLRLSLVAGPDLDDPTVDAMWRLRTDTLRLKPEVDLDADRRGFARRVRMGQRNALLVDRSGRLRGMFSMYWREAPDRSALWFLPEYGYLHRDHRGDPGITLAVLRTVPRLQLEARGRPVWFAGVGYPRSVRSIARVMRPWYTLADPEVPAAARGILEALRQEFYPDTWDPVSHRVWLPTIPDPRPKGAVGADWERYEQLLRDWEGGHALGIAVQMKKRLFVRGLGEVITRVHRALGPAGDQTSRPSCA